MGRAASELGFLLCFGGAAPVEKQKDERRVESVRRHFDLIEYSPPPRTVQQTSRSTELGPRLEFCCPIGVLRRLAQRRRPGSTRLCGPRHSPRRRRISIDHMRAQDDDTRQGYQKHVLFWVGLRKPALYCVTTERMTRTHFPGSLPLRILSRMRHRVGGRVLWGLLRCLRQVEKRAGVA